MILLIKGHKVESGVGLIWHAFYVNGKTLKDCFVVVLLSPPIQLHVGTHHICALSSRVPECAPNRWHARCAVIHAGGSHEHIRPPTLVWTLITLPVRSILKPLYFALWKFDCLSVSHVCLHMLYSSHNHRDFSWDPWQPSKLHYRWSFPKPDIFSEACTNWTLWVHSVAIYGMAAGKHKRPVLVHGDFSYVLAFVSVMWALVKLQRITYFLLYSS